MVVVAGIVILFMGRQVPRLIRKLFEQKTLAYAPDTVEIRLEYWPGKNEIGTEKQKEDVQTKAGDAFNNVKKNVSPVSVGDLGGMCIQP